MRGEAAPPGPGAGQLLSRRWSGEALVEVRAARVDQPPVESGQAGQLAESAATTRTLGLATNWATAVLMACDAGALLVTSSDWRSPGSAT